MQNRTPTYICIIPLRLRSERGTQALKSKHTCCHSAFQELSDNARAVGRDWNATQLHIDLKACTNLHIQVLVQHSGTVRLQHLVLNAVSLDDAPPATPIISMHC